jgi:hypothetical protein
MPVPLGFQVLRQLCPNPFFKETARPIPQRWNICRKDGFFLRLRRRPNREAREVIIRKAMYLATKYYANI